MSNILITGVAGAGKSHLAKKWASKGISTIDGDSMDQVIEWVAPNGDIVPFPHDIKLADVNWFKTHKFIWNESKLQKFLQKNSPIIVLGLCDNLFDVSKYFDRVYYLQVPYDIAVERLLNPDRQESNAFGRHEEQRLMLKNMIEENDRKAIEQGFYIIDATLSAQDIFNMLDLK